jgi:aconitate hydratase
MLAMGAGGLEVALAIAGQPFYVKMPEIWGVRLTGALADWVSAKDVILEMLRRHSVKGGVGRIIEYYGPGLDCLTAMDRHVIANMGAELGATASVFPSDAAVRQFLRGQERERDWTEILADPGAAYDHHEEMDLSKIEPLIAMPSSPGNVHTVREMAGAPIHQAYIGSSANPGYRDFAVVAEMVRGKQVPPNVSLDVNPTSRQILENLARDGHLVNLIHAGARIHQAGCNGCIGMGQAPATDTISLRTVPRNFPGRSGTREDKVCLVSPETAAASALAGRITDPRDCGMPYPRVSDPAEPVLNTQMLLAPLPPEEAAQVELVKGTNVASIPEFEPLPDQMSLPVLLKVGDDISTDEIMPAGAKVLPYRSNIPRISEFVYDVLDPTYPERATEIRAEGGHIIIGGRNYGQGSSREHAALAPRFLGLRMVIVKSFARIHWQNLVNFGIVPLTFAIESDFGVIQQGDTLNVEHLRAQIQQGDEVVLRAELTGKEILCRHSMSERQVEAMLAGGLINWVKEHVQVNA